MRCRLRGRNRRHRLVADCPKPPRFLAFQGNSRKKIEFDPNVYQEPLLEQSLTLAETAIAVAHNRESLAAEIPG